MGYTHYWTQKRDFKVGEWQQVARDIQAILADVEKQQIRIGGWGGDPGTSATFGPDDLGFNGVGDDAHETFLINRKRPPKEPWERTRGRSFCKTAQKPYDLAVTACLAYLESVHGYSVGSDGDVPDWKEGIELARRVLPQYTINVPRELLADA